MNDGEMNNSLRAKRLEDEKIWWLGAGGFAFKISGVRPVWAGARRSLLNAVRFWDSVNLFGQYGRVRGGAFSTRFTSGISDIVRPVWAGVRRCLLNAVRFGIYDVVWPVRAGARRSLLDVVCFWDLWCR